MQTVSVSAVTNTLAYDAFGRQIAQTDGRGNTRRTEYNALGQHSASIDALGNRTTYAYDQFGNLASVTDPLGNAIVYEYDLRGNKTYEGGATYPVRYTYDVFGKKTTMTTYRDETGGTGVSPVQGDVTTWLYDIASGSMTNKVYADGKGPSYSYTPDGKLSRRTWARGIVTDYSYDNWGNLTNTVYSDGTPTVSLAYDAFGRQTEAHDAAGVTTFLYDDFGSFINETVIGVAGTNTIERFYDTFGRSLGYALNGVRQSTLAYDLASGRIVTMLANGSDVPFTWNYLPGSDLKSSLAYPNGLSASWTYDANNRLLQVCNTTPTNVISQYAYTYDAGGRRVSCGKTGSAFAQDDTVAYAYNNRSELTNAVAAVDSDYRYAYDFDEVGNRETSFERGTNSVYTANSLNQYTAVDDFTPQFDDDGNQTLIKTATGIWSVTYNGENRPILWENVSTNSPTPNSSTPTRLSMSYDRMGRRVTRNFQRFVYDGYLQIANFKHQTSNIKLQTFIWDPTEPVATRPLVWNLSTFQPFNFSTSYYTHDGNKNVSDVVADNGDITAHYEYAPFGAVIAQRGTSAAANPWRFSSEYAEDDTATVYYNYRHYEPVMGRWMSRDPIVDLFETPYCFCGNARLGGAVDVLGLLKFGPECDAIKDACENDIADVIDTLKQFLSKLNADPSEIFNEAMEAYKKGGTDQWPSRWGNKRAIKDFADKIRKMISELEKGKREVVCCPDTELCGKDDASFYGRPGFLGPRDKRFENKIVICPAGFNDLSKWGGCGCLMVHELLHALGFSLRRGSASKEWNRKRENGMIYLARYLLNKSCKGYDVWED